MNDELIMSRIRKKQMNDLSKLYLLLILVSLNCISCISIPLYEGDIKNRTNFSKEIDPNAINFQLYNLKPGQYSVEYLLYFARKSYKERTGNTFIISWPEEITQEILSHEIYITHAPGNLSFIRLLDIVGNELDLECRINKTSAQYLYDEIIFDDIPVVTSENSYNDIIFYSIDDLINNLKINKVNIVYYGNNQRGKTLPENENSFILELLQNNFTIMFGKHHKSRYPLLSNDYLPEDSIKNKHD